MLLVLPYPPSGNASVRFVPGLPRPLRSKEAKAYRPLFRLAVLEQLGAMPAPFAGELRFRAHIIRPARRGDLDNSLKVLQDAAQGLLYRNDSQIAQLRITRSVDPQDPRILLDLSELAPLEADVLPAWVREAWGPVAPRYMRTLGLKATPSVFRSS
jgi:crossover junction endodeoxyribonuclease RusA